MHQALIYQIPHSHGQPSLLQRARQRETTDSVTASDVHRAVRRALSLDPRQPFVRVETVCLDPHRPLSFRPSFAQTRHWQDRQLVRPEEKMAARFVVTLLDVMHAPATGRVMVQSAHLCAALCCRKGSATELSICATTPTTSTLPLYVFQVFFTARPTSAVS